MPRRPSHSRAGRPSKGERRSFNVRIPAPVAGEVMAECDRRRIYYSEHISWLLEALHTAPADTAEEILAKLEGVLPPPKPHLEIDQEELPLADAS